MLHVPAVDSGDVAMEHVNAVPIAEVAADGLIVDDYAEGAEMLLVLEELDDVGTLR